MNALRAVVQPALAVLGASEAGMQQRGPMSPIDLGITAHGRNGGRIFYVEHQARSGMKVMRTDLYLRELAQRCRYWSRYTFDLTAAREFRELAQELETKAREAQRSELPDQAPRRKE
jgi:hypothetical protein